MSFTLLENIDKWLWDGLLVYLLLAVGIFLTIRLKGVQFRYLFYSLKLAFSKHNNEEKGDISQFQSLMTALAATIGIGSIAGMATAVIGGGFGAVLWMWVIALIGMATKYSEAILAVKFRIQEKNKEMSGGPMHYIAKGLKMKWLAILFALFGSSSALGGGNLIQSQSIYDAMHELFGLSPIVVGSLLAIIVGLVILGGIKYLGKINAFLVPIMALLYLTAGIVVLVIFYDRIPHVLQAIFMDAFSLRAAAKGFLGAGFMSAVQMGMARGISSNESGLGSSPIAAAAAKTDLPGRAALISMSGVFISSFIVCTITVLVIGVTNVAGNTTEAGTLINGAPLVMQAFASVLPGGGYIVALGLILFGLSTILGWSYYGEKCITFLFGDGSIFWYRCLFVCITFMGAFLHIDLVWVLADITNGLMALPNLIGVLLLSSVVASESKEFFDQMEKEKDLLTNF